MVVLPPLVCALLTMAVFLTHRMALNRTSSFLLIGIYTGYIVFSILAFGRDSD